MPTGWMDKGFGGQCPPYVHFKNQILVLSLQKFSLIRLVQYIIKLQAP